jgi:methionyl-tRNA synthetase
VLNFELNELAKIAYMVEPFIPETASKIQNLLSEEKIKVLDKPLFPRIL